MSERPILFSGPMVRALLAGTKTQTRRPVKPAPPANTVAMGRWQDPGPEPAYWAFLRDGPVEHDHPFGGAELHGEPWRCPYGQPGDRLWVRETWGVGSRPDPWGGYDGIEYRADEPLLEDGDLLDCHKVQTPDDVCLGDYRAGWKPSIHMPRWASRILLEVTEVRVERLQDISEVDAIAEGIENDPRLDPAGTCHWRVYGAAQSTGTNLPERSYESLWTSINGPGSWDANPWVWVVSFKKVGGADEQR